jgi:hypothetical protein
MRAQEFTKEARDHGPGHNNMMPTEDHSSHRMTNNTMPYEESRVEALRKNIATLEQQILEKTSAKLCRSPKKLGNSDQSSCVAQGLRAHTSKGKGHTDGKGHYLKGHRAKSTKYGGDVPDYS